MMMRVYSRKRRIEQFALEQLRGAAQAAERIFDLVRELPDHQPAAAELRQQRVLAGQAPVLGDVFDFQQQPAALHADADFGDRAIEDSVDASGRRPGEFPLHHIVPAEPRALEQRQQRLRARG